MRFYRRKSNVNTNFGTTSLPDIGDQRWINVGINVGFWSVELVQKFEFYSKILNEFKTDVNTNVNPTLVQRRSPSSNQRWINVGFTS